MTLLDVQGLGVRYGGVEALSGVSFSASKGEVIAIIGANGAGKSTLLRCIAGLVKPAEGSIVYAGDRLDAEPTHLRLRKGIVLCPEGRRLFPDMSVVENLRMGAHAVRGSESFADQYDAMCKIFPRLRERSHQTASSLSGGEQQMVAIARAMMSNPRLLMLDEPTLGIAPKLIHEIARLVRHIQSRGITILLVEQNAKLALRLAGRGIVLRAGKVIAAGDSQDLLDRGDIQSAYLGSAA